MRFLLRIIYLVLSVCFVWLGSTFAQESTKNFSLNGELFSDVYSPYRNWETETFRQVSASLWLRGSAQFNENFKAYAELSGNEFIETVRKSGKKQKGFELNLREAYGSYAAHGFEIRAGEQIIPWGKSDGINPTDFLTAKDLTFFNPDEEKRRTGGTSIFISETPEDGVSPFTFIAVMTPIPARSRLIIPPTSTNSNTVINESETLNPSIENIETAFKINYVKPQWDFSLSFFRGFDHLPYLIVTGLSGNPFSPTVQVTPKFFRQRAIGSDFSYSLKDYVLRAESAYFFTENNDASDMRIAPPHSDTVLGIERPFFTDFRAQLQGYFRFFTKYNSPKENFITPAIADVNSLLHNYQDAFRSAVTFRFAYAEPSNLWDAEIFTLFYFQGQDSVIRPKVSYLFTDSFRGTIGLERYAGSSSRPLGAFSAYNSFFVEAKYSF